MKLKTLYAVAFAMVFAASSAQAAEIIYKSDPDSCDPSKSTCFIPYGPDIADDGTVNTSGFYQFGDYIEFGGTKRKLVEATFLLSSDLDEPFPLELIIYDTVGKEIGASTTTSDTWSSSEPFYLTFLFNKLLVPNEIVYLLSLANDPDNNPLTNSLNLFLTPKTPSIGQDPAATGLLTKFFPAGLDLALGEVIATNNLGVTSPIRFIQGSEPIALGIVAEFKAVPEPTSLALLALGLLGLGFVRRRKTTVG